MIYKKNVRQYFFDIEITDALDSNKTVRVRALWDTGANTTTISSAVAVKLGLQELGDVSMSTVNGVAAGKYHLADIIFYNDFGINDIKIVSTPTLPVDCLLGTDIISRGDFTVSNFNNKTVVSFRIPSKENIYFKPDAN